MFSKLQQTVKHVFFTLNRVLATLNSVDPFSTLSIYNGTYNISLIPRHEETFDPVYDNIKKQSRSINITLHNQKHIHITQCRKAHLSQDKKSLKVANGPLTDVFQYVDSGTLLYIMNNGLYP